MSSIRHYLRETTHTLHQEIDLAASSLKLNTPEGYGHFLSWQAGVLVPLELRLESEGIARLLPDWKHRARRAALQKDLSSLGLNYTPVLPPAFDSEAALLGAAYVLEGSRLGARVVLARINSTGATDFLRHGEGLRLWQDFLIVLEGNADAQRDPQTAVRAAQTVFQLFLRSMESTLCDPAVAAQ